MNLRILVAIVRKDLAALYPLALLTALVFAADVFILRWELLPTWPEFRQILLLVVGALATLAVFQLDAPVSLVDDWLCRPVPRRELVAAKFAFLLLVAYLPGVVATLVADLYLGASLAEAVQDAVLLRDVYFSLVVPLLLLTALVTRTQVQGIGVLVVLFVCMLVLPGPFLKGPDPLRPGIGDALAGVGLGWLSMTPAKLVPLMLTALGVWLVYGPRRILQARLLLALTAAAIVLLFVLPMWLLPWSTVFAVQTTLHPVELPAEARHIYLRATRTCFPATRLAEVSTNAAFNAAREASGLQMWNGEDLRSSGPDSIAFLTAVEARRVPADWRVKLNYVQADYFAGGAEPLFSLRPARYNTGMAHAWVLPESALKELQGVTASLQLRYSLTLLEPRHYSLRTDGRRRQLPGLGYCAARLDETASHIDVDCFSALRQPAQLSAALDDIPASRVFTTADFSPAWTQWPYSQRVQLGVLSPRLSTHDTITVTAWQVAGYLDRSLSLPGILGGTSDTCGLPGANGNFQASRWRDAAPHEPSSIKVDAGVQLEVLDFGGKGTPLLLLPGLGATAHSYDELAPLLARSHRVIAITRRGAGYSGKPDFGYDTARLGQDVLAVMDAMHLEKVVLVGHSIAGEELTWLGGHHADRFAALVYLDAAYDRAQPRHDPRAARLRELNERLPPEPPIPPSALLDYEAMKAWLRDMGHVRLPEGELIAAWQVDKPFLGGTPNIDARTQQAIGAAIEAPEYERIKIPALAIYAVSDPGKALAPWHDPKDAQLRHDLAEIARIRLELQRQAIERFRTQVAQGQVLQMQDASHYILQSNTREVADAIEKFVRLYDRSTRPPDRSTSLRGGIPQPG